MRINKEKIEKATKLLLEGLGYDLTSQTNSDLVETPKRVAKAWAEICNGLEILEDRSWNVKMFDGGGGDIVEVKNIPFVSVCRHHLLIFWGTATVRYQPHDGRIVGLSKLPRMVQDCAAKLQTQEYLTQEIATRLCHAMKAEWVEVELEAEHSCVSFRGAKARGSKTYTHHKYRNQELGQFNIKRVKGRDYE